MSRQGDEKAAEQGYEDFVRRCGGDDKSSYSSYHEHYLFGFEDGITYGRATPDREMLEAFIQSIEDKCPDWTFSQSSRDALIDEFLTLENQRGQNVLR